MKKPFKFENFDQVAIAIRKNQTPHSWVNEAREYNKTLTAIVTGKNFHDVLIEQIEKIESSQRAIARRKYSKDIRDVMKRILNKRENVFQATGGSENFDISSEQLKNEFIDNLQEFKGGKSISRYLSENYFQMFDIDPNGVFFLEYKTEDGKVHAYPTFKSICGIRNYETDGQQLKWIIFEPEKKIIGNTAIFKWRVVDSAFDYSIIQTGNDFVLDEENTKVNDLGIVPGLVVSNDQQMNSEFRLSTLDKIIEVAKDFARDKSIMTIYKFQNGFPKHWSYKAKCRTCRGAGKTGSEKCVVCDGKGYPIVNDVTDEINVELPKEGEPVIAPDVAGFVQPDLETWKQYKVDLKDFENTMHDTIWGTELQQGQTGGSETATGKFIDVQPITNELNKLSDVVEWAHNKLANWTAKLIVKTQKNSEVLYHKSYGRRFIIESPDVILKRYEESRKDGVGTTVLDKLLQEWILSKYKSDPYMQERMIKKALCEPFIHQTMDEVNNIFGREQALKKYLFQEFWEQVDSKDKTVEQLKSDFNSYFATQKAGYEAPEAINQSTQ